MKNVMDWKKDSAPACGRKERKMMVSVMLEITGTPQELQKAERELKGFPRRLRSKGVQIVYTAMKQSGNSCSCVRSREIR